MHAWPCQPSSAFFAACSLGWPWTWSSSCLTNARVTSRCHCAWLLGIILESGPVSLSISCSLHIDRNRVRTPDHGTTVRKPLLLLCLPPAYGQISIGMPLAPLAPLFPNLRSPWDNAFSTLHVASPYSRLLGPWLSQEASCLPCGTQLSTVLASSPQQPL